MTTGRATDELTGAVAVVTGAARGVGASLARQLSARGARVALLGLEPEELARVSGQCADSDWWEVDVTDGEALVRTAVEVAERLGPASVVVANAGIAAGGPLLLADATSYDAVIEVNLLGSIRTVRAFLPQVVQTRGYVLQVASLAALVPIPAMSAYCASKSGVEGFAHSLRGELRHHGVGVGVAYLSWTDTDMVRGADAQPGLAMLRQRLPGVFGRTYPLEPTVVRIVEGITARRTHIYGQPWLRAMNWARAATPSVTGRPPSRLAHRLESSLLRDGPAGTAQVGAGGRANSHRMGQNRA